MKWYGSALDFEILDPIAVIAKKEVHPSPPTS